MPTLDSRQPPRWPLALVFAFVFALGFAWLAWAVHGGPGHAPWQRLDAAAHTWAMAHVPTTGPVWQALLALTHTGDGRWLAALTTLVAVGLAWRRRWRVLPVWVLACAGNGLLIRAFKLAFDRERPEHLQALITSGASFPSGHTAGSVLIYALLAALLTAKLPARQRALWLGLALAWAAAVGLSRVLLNVHWASDVAAGTCLGLASLGLAVGALQRLRA